MVRFDYVISALTIHRSCISFILTGSGWCAWSPSCGALLWPRHLSAAAVSTHWGCVWRRTVRCMGTSVRVQVYARCECACACRLRACVFCVCVRLCVIASAVASARVWVYVFACAYVCARICAYPCVACVYLHFCVINVYVFLCACACRAYFLQNIDRTFFFFSPDYELGMFVFFIYIFFILSFLTTLHQ